jgi:DNA repair exonuclease SbcCD nuclease subunit
MRDSIFLDNFNGHMVITGDTHIHNFTQYSDKSPDISSRLVHTLEVLDQIHDYCVANAIYFLVINGDIFETKSEVQCVVNNKFFDWCVKCGNSGISILLNAGNHDIASLYDERITLLHPYKALPNVEVVEDYTIFDYSMFKGFCNLAVLPYRRSIDTLKKWAASAKSTIIKNPDIYRGNNDPMNLMITHCTVLGAKITSREFLDNKKAVYARDLQQEFFDYVFLSHFHQKQTVGDKISYVGSPLQHDMSDANTVKGFYHLDCSTSKLKFIGTKYPTFNKIVLEHRDDLDKIAVLDSDNYYEIKVKTPDIIDKDLAGFKKQHRVKVIWAAEVAIKTRIENITTKTDIKDIINDFVELNNGDKLNKIELIKRGLEYVNKAKNIH